MNKKILPLVVILSLLFVGSVSAASLWGTYKGKQIIRLTVDGKPIKVSDAPAVSMDGRTMIPVYLLQQAGINYSWDQKTQTVNISSNSNSNFDPAQATNDIISLGGGGVTIINSNGQLYAMVYFKAKSSFETDWPNIMNIFLKLIDFHTDYSRVQYDNGSMNTIDISNDILKKYLSGSITDDQLQKDWVTAGPLFTAQSTPIQTPSVSSSITYPELYSNDGKTYLGKLTSNTFDSDSVFNEFGTYGSKFQSKSIWNEFGNYGSEFSNTSAFNEYATNPPIIVLNGKIIGYLTLNTTIQNSISPYSLLDWLKKNGY